MLNGKIIEERGGFDGKENKKMLEENKKISE